MTTGNRTRVVNLRREDYDVYIGRPGNGFDGYFGNPIKTGYLCKLCDQYHERASSTIHCYTNAFYQRIYEDSEFVARVLALRGKRLGCFCAPNACHGDVIAKFLNEEIETTKDGYYLVWVSSVCGKILPAGKGGGYKEGEWVGCMCGNNCRSKLIKWKQPEWDAKNKE